MQQKDLAGDHVFHIAVLGQATAGTADEWTGVVMPFRGRVTAVKWVPSAAVTADGTNYCDVNLRNRGSDGTGTSLVATRSYSATNSVAFRADTATLGASALRDVAEGDVLTVSKTNAGTGLALPDGVVQVHVQVR
jgi:hypothetical protein